MTYRVYSPFSCPHSRLISSSILYVMSRLMSFTTLTMFLLTVLLLLLVRLLHATPILRSCMSLISVTHNLAGLIPLPGPIPYNFKIATVALCLFCRIVCSINIWSCPLFSFLYNILTLIITTT